MGAGDETTDTKMIINNIFPGKLTQMIHHIVEQNAHVTPLLHDGCILDSCVSFQITILIYAFASYSRH